ncbi:hypothetical protein GCM10011390_44150 [Aureimonas endophytica]|uniref:Uncharacterized protein n=1 Tax=Aureimonas endophytica TaxID=2027858 RepID=A0A917EBG0_9HYPH|nr:hypothetical protein [Aureimonas endophytica]GGE20073.1 hypothetical protein GCM10011390_44150 [Aureimonas endophytica]
MSERGVTGYLFAFSHDDLDPSDGLRKTRVLAVARSAEEAMIAARDLIGRSDLELIEVGSDILAQAREMGLQEGQAKRL